MVAELLEHPLGTIFDVLQGARPTRVCTPEVVSCTDDERAVKCASDGLSETVLDDCGASGEVCVAGACAEVVCTPGERFCSGNAVHQCTDKGDSSTVYASCTAAQYCDDGTATCKAKVCTPNEPACSGDIATTCNAEGSGFAAGGVDCSSSSLVCSAGECKTQVCEPNTAFCGAGAVRRCSDDGLFSTVVQTCGSSQYCDDASAACKAQICTPGAAVRSGDTATSCNAEGSGYTAGGVDVRRRGRFAMRDRAAARFARRIPTSVREGM